MTTRSTHFLIASTICVGVISLACGGETYGTTLEEHGGLSLILVGEPGCTMDDVARIIQHRVDAMPTVFGVASVDQGALHVQLAGDSLDAAVPAQLFTRQRVEFASVLTTQIGGPGPNGRWLVGEEDPQEYFQVAVETPITNTQIAFAASQLSDFGPQVLITFDDAGAADFAALTEQSIGQKLAIIIDDVIISAPRVAEAIRGGQVTITGIDDDEARWMAAALSQPPLPCDLTLMQTTVIGPTGDL